MRGLNWFPSGKEQKETTKGIHPDFRLRDGEYYHNRPWELIDGPIVSKVGFKFDDPKLLDDCPFIAKVGINWSEGPKYFGLAYAHDGEQQTLIDWAQRFEYVRLMQPLSRTGELTDGTQTISIKG